MKKSGMKSVALLCVSVAFWVIVGSGCGSVKIVEVKDGKEGAGQVSRDSVGGKAKSSKSSARVKSKERKEIVRNKPVGTIESSVLTINSSHITADDVISRIRPELVLAGQKYSEKMYYARARELAMQAIYDMIYETLLYEEISSRISDEQNPAVEKAVDQAVENMIDNQAGGSRVRFERQLAERGMDMAKLRKQLRKQILTQQYLREKFRSKVIVTRNDLWEYYKKHHKEFVRPARARVFMIELDIDKYLPKGTSWESASKQAKQIAEILAERKAKEILKELKEGKPFAELAKKYSDSAIGRLGGDIGWITRGSYRYKEIEDCVFSLKPGEVGGPIRIGRKIYIVKLADFIEAKETSFVDAQEQIRKKLEQKIYAELVNEHIQKLLKKSQISAIQPFLETVLKRIPSYYSMRAKRSNPLH